MQSNWHTARKRLTWVAVIACYIVSLAFVLMAVATLAAGVWVFSVAGVFIALVAYLFGRLLARLIVKR